MFISKGVKQIKKGIEGTEKREDNICLSQVASCYYTKRVKWKRQGNQGYSQKITFCVES